MRPTASCPAEPHRLPAIGPAESSVCACLCAGHSGNDRRRLVCTDKQIRAGVSAEREGAGETDLNFL